MKGVRAEKSLYVYLLHHVLVLKTGRDRGGVTAHLHGYILADMFGSLHLLITLQEDRNRQDLR